MSSFIEPIYSRYDFEFAISDQRTLDLVYNFYIYIRNSNLWNELNNENRDNILNIASYDQVLSNDGHSGFSINFCFNHILFLKENGYNKYVNYLINRI